MTESFLNETSLKKNIKKNQKLNITNHREISKIKYVDKFSSLGVSGPLLRAGCLRLYEGRLVFRAICIDSI